MAENKKTVSFSEFKKKLKLEERKRKAKEAVISGCQKAWDHRYEIAGAIIIGAGTIKTISRTVNNASERYEKDHRIWDPSEGHYWKTSRKLSNSDYLEMERLRQRYCCTKGEALDMMGLLRH